MKVFLKNEEDFKEMKRLFWDYKIPDDKLHELIEGKIENIGGITIETLYSKILTTYGWYKILDFFPGDMIFQLLDEKVLQRVWPKSLQQSYRNAKRLLSE